MTDEPRFRYASRRLQDRLWQQKTADSAWNTAHDPKVGGLLLQSRSKARAFAKRSNVFLGVLVFTVVAFLGSFVLSPLIQRAAYEYFLSVNKVGETEAEILSDLQTQRDTLEGDFVEALGTLEGRHAMNDLYAPRTTSQNHIGSSVHWGQWLVYLDKDNRPIIWKTRSEGIFDDATYIADDLYDDSQQPIGPIFGLENGTLLTLSDRGLLTSGPPPDIVSGFPTSTLAVTFADLGIPYAVSPIAFFELSGLTKYLLSFDDGSLRVIEDGAVVQRYDMPTSALVEERFGLTNAMRNLSLTNNGELGYFDRIKRLMNGEIAAFSDYQLIVLSPDAETVRHELHRAEVFGPNGSEWFRDVFINAAGDYIFVGDEGSVVRLPQGSGPESSIDVLLVSPVSTAAQLSRNNIHLALDNGQIFGTTDGGVTWVRRNTGPQTRITSITTLLDGSGYFGYGGGGTIGVSRDGGANWVTRQSTLTADDALLLNRIEGGAFMTALTSTGQIIEFRDFRETDANTLAIAAEEGTTLSLVERVEALGFDDTELSAASFPFTRSNGPDYSVAVQDYLRQEDRIDAIRSTATELGSAFSSGLTKAVAYGPSDVRTRMELGIFMRDCLAETDASDTSQTALITACAEQFHKIAGLDGSKWWSDTVALLPGGILLLFFLSTLARLYRYNLRLSVFHSSRADALEMVAQNFSDEDIKKFVDGTVALGADSVDFGSTTTPADKITDIIKTALNKAPNG